MKFDESETEVSPTTPGDGTSAMDGGRFVPGTILDARYRIVALLGRGGMGEVYRAEDLKLGETVALKFLPARLSADGAALARFHREVRTARGIAHPNVVRVYDLGEHEGRPFLSMEYVDGEDLSVLLKRIGLLPEKKGVELARQLCAGLAAAHQAGVLHRDLKPANVMVDQEGQAKISDFGLAQLAADLDARDGSGTPQYMAPEQLTTGQSSFASDIYALGLVLYELFTGERPFQANSRRELVDQQESGGPPSLSSHVEALDPVIERAILPCLEPEPASRPSSPLQVAAGLPGGDPLAAALAAGETPSPEMVARAVVPGTLARPIGWALLATVLGSIFLVLTLLDRQSSLQLDGLPLEPEVLEHQARGLLEEIGWTEFLPGLGGYRFGDSVYELAGSRRTRDDWLALASGRRTFLVFLYRASQGALTPNGRWRSYVTFDDPPRNQPGQATVVFDSRGRLRELLAVPATEALNPAGGTPDWPTLFAAADLDPAAWTPVEPARAPPIHAERIAAWQGSYPERPQDVVLIEAAARGDRVVFWRVSDGGTENQTSTSGGKAVGFALGMFTLMLLVAGWRALRNVRSGRGDRRGSLRIALAVGLGYLVHQLTLLARFTQAAGLSFYLSLLAQAAFMAGAVWLVYMAIEPLMRKHFSRGLVAWSRVLAGRFGDPLVGRDALIALAITGIAQVIFLGFNEWALSTSAGGQLAGAYPHGLNALAGPAVVIGNLFIFIQIMLPLGLMFLFVVPRLVIRASRAAAIVGALAVLGFCFVFQGGGVAGFIWGLFIALLTWRIGFVGLVAMGIFMNNLVLSPASLDTSAWWSLNSWIGVGAVVALAVWAFQRASKPSSP